MQLCGANRGKCTLSIAYHPNAKSVYRVLQSTMQIYFQTGLGQFAYTDRECRQKARNPLLYMRVLNV